MQIIFHKQIAWKELGNFEFIKKCPDYGSKLICVGDYSTLVVTQKTYLIFQTLGKFQNF